jgi:hypothetical protein
MSSDKSEFHRPGMGSRGRAPVPGSATERIEISDIIRSPRLQGLSRMRQFTGEDRPLLAVPRGQLPAHVLLDDHLGQVQSEAGPLGFLLGGEVGMEYPFERIREDPPAVVADLDDDRPLRTEKSE